MTTVTRFRLINPPAVIFGEIEMTISRIIVEMNFLRNFLLLLFT